MADKWINNAIKTWLPIIVLAGGMIACAVRFGEQLKQNERDINKNVISIEKLATAINLSNDKMIGNRESIIRIETNLDNLTTSVNGLTTKIDQSQAEQRAVNAQIVEYLRTTH